ncbi:MAG: 4-hydroxythreonine-4-phosphate dehydrogenase PdxA [Elusimicrobia bacterium]|nr:4-hydroxythreonine-4-phosphate dehydrogenase PdxA [Elusimicrobiota bacterium]
MFKPTIAITIGDPSGIGSEIVKKAILDKSILKICKPVVIDTNFLPSHTKLEFIPGKPSKKSDKAAISLLNKTIELLKKGCIDATVTSPVSKSAFGRFRGHTEFFAENFGIKEFEMLMVADDLKILLLTRHIPLKDVAKKLNIKNIVKSIKIVYSFIKDKYDIKNPSVIVCGLNPHCGDKGLVGNEELKIIIPAIKMLKKAGLNISGPVNSDIAIKNNKHDLIVCMYHDQAMVPLKLLKPDKIVNVTVGLPFIRTSPGHGTAYNIAGKGIADPQSMIEAIKLACLLTRKNKKVK